MWRAGQKIGDYELIAQLREGGMATLWLARRSGAAGFTRHVAIKVVHPDLAEDEQFRNMFIDEALLSSRIQHPNVVHVEELGEHEGAHYLAMEFVHGCSLSQLQRALVARGRRLAPAFATRIAMHVADALHAAHETRDEHGRLLEVVHRDVTPENVLLAYAGHVKLIDFGIAKAYGRRHRTLDGLLKGKFRYMAPEQALGRPVDRRVDIYQLGIVLWEMLTLRRLFDAERDVDLLQSVQHPRVKPPSALVERIPPALDSAVMAALAPDPRARPADAQSFARALARAMPSAHEVDSGALSALLLAAMKEQRQRDRGTYPPGVYDRLDQQLDTLPLPGAGPRNEGASTVLMRHTLEHTAPAGGDSADRSSADQTGRTTQPERAPRSRRGARPRRPRERQLVQLDHWRTTLTRIVREAAVSHRALWIGLGCSLGLVGAAALIALASGRAGQVAPPALPRPIGASIAPLPRKPSRSAPEDATRSPTAAGTRAEPPAAIPGHSLAIEPSAAGSTDAGRRAARRAPSEPKPRSRAREIIVVDGIPLAPDPGF